MAKSELQHKSDKYRDFIPAAFIERSDAPVEGSPANVPLDMAIVHTKPSLAYENLSDTWIFLAQIGKPCGCACGECENCEAEETGEQNPDSAVAIPLSSIDGLIEALLHARKNARERKEE